MRLVKGIVATVAAIVVLFVVIGLLLPREAEVERDILIDAPPHAVFMLVNDFREFNRWSPWADIDPDTRYTFSGPTAGLGARMGWASEDDRVGTGSQEIVASEPYRLVRTALDFGDMGQATAEYRLEPSGDGTQVTWALHTDFGHNPLFRWTGLFFDAMVGPDYEKGLARLKALAENLPDPDFGGVEITLVTVEPVLVATMEGATVTDDPALIEQAIASAMATVERYLVVAGLHETGPRRIIAREWSEAENRFLFEAAIPVDRVGDGVAEDGPVSVKLTWSGRAAMAVQDGSHDPYSIYEHLYNWIYHQGFEPTEVSWEELMDEATTHIHVAIR